MCSDSGSHCWIHKRWLVLQGLGPLQLPGCAQRSFQAFPGCTIWASDKGEEGEMGCLEAGCKSSSVGDQTIFRTPKEVKAFVFSKDYDLLVTGGGHWAMPDLLGQELWCASPELGEEMWCPGCHCRVGVTGVCSVSSGPWLCGIASDMARHPRAQHSSSLLSTQQFLCSYKYQSKIISIKKCFAEIQILFSGSLPGGLLHP